MAGNTNKITDLLVITWKLTHVGAEVFEHYTQHEILPNHGSITHKPEPSFVLKTCERIVYVCLCPYHINTFPALQCKTCILDTCVMKELAGWANNIEGFQSPQIYSGEEAFRYLCIIASSIDSSTLGESEILGQFKQAYLKQKEKGTLYGLLETLINYAYRTGKRVHNLSDLPHGKISIISNAEQLFNDWLIQANTTKNMNDFFNVAIIGTGEMGEKVYHFLHTNTNLKITVFTYNGNYNNPFYTHKAIPVLPYTDFINTWVEFDAVVLCSQCDKPFLTTSLLTEKIHEHIIDNKLFLDLGVPRNCEPEINTIKGLTLYQMDKLLSIVEKNQVLRQQAVTYANTIIDKEITYVKTVLAKKEYNNLIISLRNELESVATKRLQEIPNVELLPPDFQRWYHNTIHELMHISQNHLENSLNITTTKDRTFNDYAMEVDINSTVKSE